MKRPVKKFKVLLQWNLLLQNVTYVGRYFNN